MEKEIKVEIVDGFIMYNHDKSVVLAEADEGEVFTAVLNEDSREYFAKDKKGREFPVASIGFPWEVFPEEGMKLIDES